MELYARLADQMANDPRLDLCGVVVSSSWHDPVACAFKPGHTKPHSWASIPALPSIYSVSRDEKAKVAEVTAKAIRQAREPLYKLDELYQAWATAPTEQAEHEARERVFDHLRTLFVGGPPDLVDAAVELENKKLLRAWKKPIT